MRSFARGQSSREALTAAVQGRPSQGAGCCEQRGSSIAVSDRVAQQRQRSTWCSVVGSCCCSLPFQAWCVGCCSVRIYGSSSPTVSQLSVHLCERGTGRQLPTQSELSCCVSCCCLLQTTVGMMWASTRTSTPPPTRSESRRPARRLRRLCWIRESVCTACPERRRPQRGLWPCVP